MKFSLSVSKRWLLVLGAVLIGGFLRLHLLGTVTTPYWEEVALGYDAYSLLQTGKDHHGNPYPIVAVESFGDWKPAGYFYAALPFVKLLGLTVTAVRLPAALAGIVIILITVLLAKKLEIDEVATGFIAALSPWGIIFSRAAWEVNLGTTLFLTGIVSALYTHPRQTKKLKVLLWAVSIFCIVAAAYTYHALRIIAPVVFVLVVFLQLLETVQEKEISIRNIILKVLPRYAVPIVVVSLLLLPLLLAIRNPQIAIRFTQTSIFTDLSVIEESNELKALHDNSLLSRALYHRYVLFGKVILEKFFEHLSPAFLFFVGDANPRHSTQLFGQLYHLDAVLIFLGLVYFTSKRKRQYWFLLGWLIVAILPSAITKATPHALRTLPAAPVFWLTAAAGVTLLINKVTANKIKVAVFSVLALMYVLGAAIFWRFYTSVYPQLQAERWQYGYERVVTTINEFRNENRHAPVYVTRDFGRPAMYYWFYSKTDPRLVQLSAASVPKDQGEFLAFESITFGGPFSPQDYSLLVLSQSEYALVEDETNFQLRQQIKIPQSSKGWVIVEKQNE